MGIKTQALKLDKPGFESQFYSLLHVWVCGLIHLNLSFTFWAMGGIICTQWVVLKNKYTSRVPRTQRLRTPDPRLCLVWSCLQKGHKASETFVC